ncbi:metal-dependent transcriptional regulator [uncultured Amnibacterium sp.]|uniref:metal-dependent transcriptional regulator n=1 Tax=uncultured Amnibacterium sp. TaxID=1631851 RepID=UPI0035CA39E2
MEISATSQDYLKAIWTAQEWGGSPISATALAVRFAVTTATVSDTVKRLAANGLVVHEPYKAITLTPDGERHAVRMVRRHRLIETFLVVSLGYAWDEVHDEAERLEHAVSDVLIDRIDALLGHPERDPHGDPIPSPAGTLAYPDHVVPLAAAAPGRYRITRISDADPGRLGYFRERGLLPDAVITVTERDEQGGTVLVATGRQPALALAAPAGDAILLVAERS